jgi:hypothetical protein
MNIKSIYMPLLDEGIEVCRPIEADALGGGRYHVLGPVPADEVWAYMLGTIVRLRQNSIDGGNIKVAVLNE